jgi:tetratricopeptide (TPR) repeat protein
MANKSIIELITEILRSSDLSWLLPNLRQDGMIWTSLNDSAFLDKLIYLTPSKAHFQATDFSPMNLALLALNQTRPIDNGMKIGIKEVSDQVLQTATHSYPELVLSQHGPSDLSQAGLVALALASQYQQTMSWLELIQSLPEGDIHTWSTPIACLLGLIQEPSELLKALVQPDANSLRYGLAIHAVLSNPLSVQEQLILLSNLWIGPHGDSLPSADKSRFIDQLHQQNPQVAAVFCENWLDDHSLDLHEIETIQSSWPQLIRQLADVMLQIQLREYASSPDELYSLRSIQEKLSHTLYADLLCRTLLPGDPESGDYQRINEYQTRIGDKLEIFRQIMPLAGSAKIEAQVAVKLNQQGQLEITPQFLPDSDEQLPDQPESLYATALLSLRSGDLQRSNNAATRLIKLVGYERKVDEVPVWGEFLSLVNLGKLLVNLGRADEASQIFELAVQQCPNDPTLLELLAGSYQACNQGVKAAEIYGILVSLEPRNLDNHRKYADCLSKLDQWEACLRERAIIVESNSSAPMSSRIQDLYEYARSALNAKRPELAMNTCKDILVNNPEDIRALIYLGKAQIAIHQVEAGLQYLVQATQLSPATIEAWLALADAQKEQEELKTAISTLINATMLLPDAAQLHFALGELYLQDNAPTLALPELQRAFELAPEEPATLVKYGQSLLILGHAEKAQQVLATAYRLEPGYPELAPMYSKLLIYLGRVEEAIAPLEMMVNSKLILDPQIYLDYARCILTIIKLGATDHPPMKALIALNEAMQIAPEIIEAKALTAEVLYACGENELAYQAYHDALETELKDDKTWFERLSYGLGCTATAIGKYDVAIAALQEAGQINPTNPAIFKTLSDTYLLADFPEDAVRAARNVLIIDGENADHLSWFARQMMRFTSLYPQVNHISPEIGHNQITSEILIALNKAIQLAPTRVDLLVQLGDFQSQTGSKDEATSTFTSISLLDYASVKDLITASEYLSKLGEHQAAIQSLEKALAADKNNPEGHVSDLYKNLAHEYLKGADPVSAIRTLDQAIALIPDDRSLLMKKLELLLELGNPIEALSCIEETQQNARKNTPDADLCFLASRINRSTGNLAGAVDQAKGISRLFLPPGKSININNIPLRYRVWIAELYRSLLKSHQAYQLIDAERPAERSEFETELEYLGYVILSAELAIDIGKLPPLQIQEIHLEQSHPFFFRLAALQARILNKLGDSVQAQQMLKYAVSPVNLPIRNFSGWETSYFEFKQELSICETALEIGAWDIATMLTKRLLNMGKNDPLVLLCAAKEIILQAEFNVLCNTFGVVEHKAKGYEQDPNPFESCLGYLNNALSILNNYPQDPLIAELGSNDDQIHRWIIRARIVFDGRSSNLADLSENLSRIGNLEDVPALVRCYHLQAISESDSDSMTKIIKMARGYPGEPGVVLQAALAMQDTSPDGAMRSLQVALQEHPSLQNPTIAFCNITLSRLAEVINDPTTAEQAIESALAYWPDESYWQREAAQLYNDHHNTHGAILHMIEAARLAPAEISYHILLGELYLENANNDRNVLTHAQKAFETAVALNPNEVNGLIGLATTKYALNDMESANEITRRALFISPDRAEIYQLLSAIAIRSNDYQGAYEYANKALLISPKDIQSLLVLARSLSALGRHHEAIAKLNGAINEFQQPEQLYLERVNILYKMAGARAALNELISLNNSHPENFDILNALSRMHAEAGEYENAVLSAQQALTTATDRTSLNEQANIHLLLGQIFRKSGRLDQSIEHLNEAVRLAPDRLEPYLELGLARKERREYQQALQIFELATSIAPNDPRAPFQAGLALKESKDYKSSETMLRKAVSLAPNDLSIRRQLAAVVALNLVHNPRLGRS